MCVMIGYVIRVYYIWLVARQPGGCIIVSILGKYTYVYYVTLVSEVVWDGA